MNLFEKIAKDKNNDIRTLSEIGTVLGAGVGLGSHIVNRRTQGKVGDFIRLSGELINEHKKLSGEVNNLLDIQVQKHLNNPEAQQFFKNLGNGAKEIKLKYEETPGFLKYLKRSGENVKDVESKINSLLLNRKRIKRTISDLESQQKILGATNKLKNAGLISAGLGLTGLGYNYLKNNWSKKKKAGTTY